MSSKPRKNTYDLAIIGGGILGCSLAVALGNQGRNVLLIERDLSEPDRIVGELLQPGGVQALTKLGLRHCLEGIDAIPTRGYEVIYHGEGVNIPYPLRNGKRPEGRAFHHGKFINKLRDAAKAAKGVTIVEATAKDVVKDEVTGQVLGVVVKRKDAKEEEFFFASLTVSADGYASNFRKRVTSVKPQVRSTFVGLELIDCVLPSPNHGHVIIGTYAPILLYQIGTHETRALVDMPTKVPDIRAHLRTVTLPSLPASIRPSFEKAIEAERLPSMPNSFLPAKTNSVRGMILLGDALNMRHPLTGGGMTVAFNDVVLLERLLKGVNLEDTDAVLDVMKTFHWQRKSLTSVINILAQALYSLFAADDPYLCALQRGCFRYFEMGGECIDGPVGLLAGITANRWVLFYHFFSVALYSIWVMFGEMNPFLWPWGLVKAVLVFWKACVVIFPYIWSEAKS